MKRISFLIICLAHSLLSITSAPPDEPKIYDIGQKSGHYSARAGKAIDTLVMHYTAESTATTFAIFLDDEKVVSSHYIISEEGHIFRNIADEKAAHHAGDSYWNGATGRSADDGPWNLNLNSLGIEHVNMGYKVKDSQPKGTSVPGSSEEWYPFDDEQIKASIALSKYLVAQYNIKPENVVGHSDIAPKRKVDPGPLFPWKRLHEEGVGAWPNLAIHDDTACLRDALKSNDLEGSWLIPHLHHWGYKKPDNQASARDIVRTFQMHFRARDISGNTDLETAQILDALLCQYKAKTNEQCACKK